MRKSHILIVLLSILCLPLSAQTERETESIVLEQGRQTKEKKPFREVLNDLFKRPGTRQIRQENEVLRSELDSLQLLVDSLRGRVYLDEREIAVLEREEQQGSFEYTPEEQDSLLQLWYKNTLATDFDAVNEYNMDSVRFSSNVSDAEMMRRLSAMNSFITLPYNDVVKNYIILYSERMPSKMGRVLGLSSYYFPIFEDILLRYGLPQELKYMAIIESMLNPVATSRAGARGIWQFMYQTGVGYGLEINSCVDGPGGR